jgi:8-hydroxy-5-deazaflavin:NADPH oxidoreductase
MRVGILGSGTVGRTLGTGFLAHGHEVVMGTRTPESKEARAWRDASRDLACVGSYEDAAKWCELAVLASVWEAVPHVVELCGAANLAGKVVIDVTNPLTTDAQHHSCLTVGRTDSAGEGVQRMLPDARVVKAFNIAGYQSMVSPVMAFGPPTMFLCGNDDNAKEIVAEIAKDFGWEPADLGDITAARAIEPMTLAWLLYGRRYGMWDHAFKMIRP